MAHKKKQMSKQKIKKIMRKKWGKMKIYDVHQIVKY
jgi:ribonuclease I